MEKDSRVKRRKYGIRTGNTLRKCAGCMKEVTAKLYELTEKVVDQKVQAYTQPDKEKDPERSSERKLISRKDDARERAKTLQSDSEDSDRECHSQEEAKAKPKGEGKKTFTADRDDVYSIDMQMRNMRVMGNPLGRFVATEKYCGNYGHHGETKDGAARHNVRSVFTKLKSMTVNRALIKSIKMDWDPVKESKSSYY